MRWHSRREAEPIEPSRMVNPRRAELETAKEILAETFGGSVVSYSIMAFVTVE